MDVRERCKSGDLKFELAVEIELRSKATIMMVVRTGTMKINFFTRTLRPLLVKQAPSEANDCSLLANVELVYVRETHSLHPSRRLTNRSNPC